MKCKTVLFLILSLFYINFSEAQFCTSDNRFTEAEYFETDDISSLGNVTYASNVIDGLGREGDLEMDVYFPSIALDSLAERPFVLLLHGGGFQSGNKSIMRGDCLRFARKGFVAATMNYRIGFDESDPLNQIMAGYRVQQDVNAALRFVVENKDVVGVDTAWMFLGGRSAGAIASLLTAYSDSLDWDLLFPGIGTQLGALNTSGNTLTHSFSLKGILNNWGMAQSLAMDPSKLLPTISFHGAGDNIVPIDSSENGFVGSSIIHDILQANDVCSELTVDSSGAHGILTNSEGSEYRVQRASCFFKSIFCDDCNSSFLTDIETPNCSMVTSSTSIPIDQFIRIYPNPFHNWLNIEGELESFQIQILDTTGRLLKSLQKSDALKTFNVSNLSSGVYFIKIENIKTKEVKIQKFIKG